MGYVLVESDGAAVGEDGVVGGDAEIAVVGKTAERGDVGPVRVDAPVAAPCIPHRGDVGGEKRRGGDGKLGESEAADEIETVHKWEEQEVEPNRTKQFARHWPGLADDFAQTSNRRGRPLRHAAREFDGRESGNYAGDWQARRRT